MATAPQIVVIAAVLGVPEQPSPAPRLELGQRYVFAGTHLQEETFDIALTVRNTGTAPLKIKSVTTDCACVEASAEIAPIEPGKQVEIPITADTSDFHGRIRRVVRIHSNDPKYPVTRAIVEYDVVRPITNPRSVNLGVLRPNQRVIRCVPIAFHGPGAVQLLYARSGDPSVETQLPEVTINEGQPAEMILTVTVPEAIGRFRVPVDVHTDSAEQPKVSTTILGYVSEDITASASSLDLGRIESRKSAEAELRLCCGAGTKLNRVSVSSKSLRVQRVDSENDTTLLVKLTHRLGLGTLKAALCIETTGRERQKIHIPVTATVVGR